MSRRRPVAFESDDEEEPILQASTSVKNRASVVNPVIVDNDDGKAPLYFRRAKTYVGNRPSVVNPVVVDHDDGKEPLCFKKATTFVKNRTWGVNSVIFDNDDNDDDEAPLLFARRASTSVKSRPTLSNRRALGGLDRQLLGDHFGEQVSTEDSEGDERTQKSEDHAKSGSVDGGRPKKKHKGTTSIPTVEDTMFTGQKASPKGQQYSISRCLEVLHGMDDVSDEIKVLASDVLKDAASREFFLCYEPRLRGLWLKKEVAKLGAQLPP